MREVFKYIVVFVWMSILISIPTRIEAVANVLDAPLFGIISEGSDFLTMGNDVSDIIVQKDVENVSGFLYKVLFGIAIVIAIIVGLILGIQFMIGSIDEQAKIKEALIPYIVACLVIFGTFTIWKMVVNWGEDIEDELAEFADDTSTTTP